MDILIVGAGIGGLTLAALLEQRGCSYEILEIRQDIEHAGYMLGLYPLGSRVLHGLDLHDEFLDASVPLDRYKLIRADGGVLRSYPVGEIFEEYGPYRAISRPDLVRVLEHGVEENRITFGATVDRVWQEGGRVWIETEGEERGYDLLVGADGMHSTVREQTFSEDTYRYRDTGWGAWVWWSDTRDFPRDEIHEYWGDGRFLGIYPVADRIGAVALAPEEEQRTEPYRGRAADIRGRFEGLVDVYPALFDDLPADDAESMYYWPLVDVRCERWVDDRIVLLGDAACGFLPTAGVGASMAMESAAALDDELGRTDAAYLPQALELFQRRRRERVETLQDESRKMGRYMLVEHRWTSRLRDLLMRFYSLERLAADLTHSFDEPI